MDNYFKVAEEYIKDKNILEYLMYMGSKKICYNNKQITIYLYKHYNTRKYINISNTGLFFGYNINNYYCEISKKQAIEYLLS